MSTLNQQTKPNKHAALLRAIKRHYKLRRESVAVVENAAKSMRPECPTCSSHETQFDYVNPNYRGNTGVLIYFNCLNCKRLFLVNEFGESHRSTN